MVTNSGWLSAANSRGQECPRHTGSATYRATTISISAFSWSYGSAPGWYMATLPVRSSSTSVGVVDAPYASKLDLLIGTGMSRSLE